MRSDQAFPIHPKFDWPSIPQSRGFPLEIRVRFGVFPLGTVFGHSAILLFNSMPENLLGLFVPESQADTLSYSLFYTSNYDLPEANILRPFKPPFASRVQLTLPGLL